MHVGTLDYKILTVHVKSAQSTYSKAKYETAIKMSMSAYWLA